MNTRRVLAEELLIELESLKSTLGVTEALAMVNIILNDSKKLAELIRDSREQ